MEQMSASLHLPDLLLHLIKRQLKTYLFLQ